MEVQSSAQVQTQSKDAKLKANSSVKPTAQPEGTPTKTKIEASRLQALEIVKLRLKTQEILEEKRKQTALKKQLQALEQEKTQRLSQQSKAEYEAKLRLIVEKNIRESEQAMAKHAHQLMQNQKRKEINQNLKNSAQEAKLAERNLLQEQLRLLQEHKAATVCATLQELHQDPQNHLEMDSGMTKMEQELLETPTTPLN